MTKRSGNPVTTNQTKRALIVGLGISGISTAIALKQSGWEPTIVERAAGRRRGGYFIGLSGIGRNAAQHLGAFEGIHDRRSSASKNFAIDRTGITGPTVGFADAPADLGPWMMLRGDVEEATYNALPDDVPIRFNTKPVDVWQNASGVRVTLEDTETGSRTEETFDLLVGADGIRSTVRSLVFGPMENYLEPLNCMICAFELPDAPPGLDQEEGLILTEAGHSFWLFPFKDHAPTVLFTYATDDPQAERKKDPRKRLREVFGDQELGQYMSYAMEHLDETDDFIFDTTDQVKMDSWHAGRVVLVGDSAWCPTLYSGMGATTGIAGADLLGAALRKHPDDLEAAFQEWEEILRPKVAQFQKMGATEGRLNFVALNQAELEKRNKSVEQRRKMLKLVQRPALRPILKHVPMLKTRNGDLTKSL